MVQKVPFTSTSGNTMTIGTGTSRVIMGADSGNLKIQDSQSNTSIIEAGAGIVGASAISVVANPAALPFNPISSAGSLAFTTSTSSLYISNGSGWYKISMVNTSPTITLSSTTAEPESDNLTIDFTYTITEPEGTPTTVSLANSGIATTGNVAITHTTSNNHVRLVFDGSTEYSGDATVTLSVSDGVNTGTGTITINTAYTIKNSKYEALTLLATNPPGITTAKQQSFSFDGTGDYVTASSVDTAGTGQFTAEAFFYANSLPSVGCIMAQRATTPSTNNYAQWLVYVQSNGNLAWYNGVSGQRVVETGAGGVVANRWYHVAITRNSSNVMTMWLDGVSVGTRSSQTQNWNYAPFSIGANGNGSEPFNGYISNVRWIVGTALYTSNFTVPTSPLTAVSNTKLLTLQGSTTDYSGENETVTASGDAAYNTKSPFEPAGTVYTNKFVRDTSDSAHTVEMNGTAAQSHTTTVSPYTSGGYSAFFDGSGDSIYMPHDSGWQFGTGDFTVEAWVYPNTIPGGGVNNDMTVWGHFGSTRTMFFYLSNADLGPVLWDGSSGHGSSLKAKLNQWTHIAWVRSSGTMKTYVDGKLGGTTTSYTTNFNEGTKYPWIGASEFSNRYFHGYISDLRVVKGTAVYTTTFTPPRTRLTAITNTKLLTCHLPYFKDGSSDNHTLTVNGNTYLESFAPYEREAYNSTKHGGSFYIDNAAAGNIETTDSASNEIQLGSGDFTLEFWYRPKSVTSFWEALLSKRYATTGGWRVYKNDAAGTIKWYRSTTNSITTSVCLFNNTWTHLAVVKSGSTMKIYANGVEVGSASDTYDYTTSTAGEIEFGAGSVTSELPGEGHFADLRIVVGTAVYTGAFTPPTRPLTKTGGTYPSTTNVNTSITASHTKLLLNLNDVLVGDATQFQSLEMEGNVTSSLGKSKFTDKPTIYFDGNGDYLSQNIQAPDDADLMKIGTQDFTVEGYVYALSINADSQYRRIFAYGDNGTDSIQLYINPSTGAIVYDPNDSSAKITGTSNIQNTWKHFALTRSGSQVQLHVNGTVEGTTLTDTGNKTQAAGQFLIGKYPGFSGHFHGYLDNLRVLQGKTVYPYYSEPVTLTTTNSGMTKPNGTTPTVSSASNTLLLTCHTGTTGSQTITDGSSNSTSITVNGNTVISDFGPGPGMKSVYFDGTGDYLSLTTASALGTGSWTIEYWVYHSSIDSNGIHINFDGDSDYAPAFYFINTFDGFKVYHTGTMSNHSYSSGHVNALDSVRIVSHKWYHMAYVHNDSTGKLAVFANGALVAEASYNGNISSTAVRIGGSTLYSHMLNGYISNLRVVKGQALYDKDFTAPTSRFR